MQDLSRTLLEYDLELLGVIANRWDVDLNTRDQREAAARLEGAMREPERAAEMWRRLDDSQRQVLQTVLGSAGHRMQSAMFKRMFGEIRIMGPDKREREKPYLNPISPAEALYYRGLIGTALDKTARGTTSYIFVPTDLAPVMPTHQTSYITEPTPEPVIAVPQPENIRPADTILVDDLATFLAYCQLNNVPLVDGGVPAELLKTIKPHFLGTATPARLALMVALARELNIAAAEADGTFRVLPTARKWLELRRTDQVRQLAETWKQTTLYNELWFTPGLRPELNANWQNDPLLARQIITNYLELVPPDQWWSVDELISEVKEEEPDFQRPNGDYDSWYIRDAQTNQYLRGFETWDRIDGAMLRFIVTGIMNGLGLVNSAQSGASCRMTAYGRAFIGIADWPSPRTEQPCVTIHDDGSIDIPRAASRYDRFQVARFTEWVTAADPFVYRISPTGLAQAVQQGIQAPKILDYLRRITPESPPIPDSVVQLLETWGQGADSPAMIEHMLVLRVATPEVLTYVQSTPALRQFLGAPLGPTASAVREDKWNDLVEALQAHGILVQVEI